MLDLRLATGRLVFHLPDIVLFASYVWFCIKPNKPKMLGNCSGFDMSHHWQITSFFLPTVLPVQFYSSQGNKPCFRGPAWLLNIHSSVNPKTSGTLDQCLSMGLYFLSGISLGSATATRVTPCCSTEWGWIKSLQANLRARQGGFNHSDPHREAQPLLPEKNTS